MLSCMLSNGLTLALTCCWWSCPNCDGCISPSKVQLKPGVVIRSSQHVPQSSPGVVGVRAFRALD